jgi:acetyl esterase/lipase
MTALPTDPETSLRIPARTIPVPTTISEQAQAFLAGAAQRIAALGGKPPSGGVVAAADAALAVLRPRVAGFKGEVRTIDIGNGASLYHIIPEGLSGRRTEVAYVDIHGGGFVAGGGEMCRILAQLRAMDFEVEVWSIDYRLAPQHRYPAALDDCMAAWREILKVRKPENIVVAGGSAGGNLAAALTLRARAEGLPIAAGLLLLTPALDLTGAGDTRVTNMFLDVILTPDANDSPAMYIGGADARQPYLSPIYAEIGTDWPPTLLYSGTRDLLLSDTVRMHRHLRRSGIRAELHVTEAGPHGGFMGAPEDREMFGECRQFCEKIWGLAPA